MFEIQDVDLFLAEDTSSSKDYQRVFFDIEGGLSYASDIIQIACVTTNWDFKITNVKCSYFRNIYPLTREETDVHGLTEEFLWKNATSYFSTEVSKFPFYPDKPTMFISYTSFDIRKIAEQLEKASLPFIDFGNAVSSLTLKPQKSNYYDGFILGRTKLSKTITEERQVIINSLINEAQLIYPNIKIQLHDALYDTIVLLALCKGLMK